MLIKSTPTTNLKRARILQQKLQSNKIDISSYRLKGVVKTKKQRAYSISQLPLLLMPGYIINFMRHANKARVIAIIKTATNHIVLAPAVRGVKIGDYVNHHNKLTLGSFTTLSSIPKKKSVSNIFLRYASRPILLRAPGSAAKLLARKIRLKFQLRMPTHVKLLTIHNLLVQIGSNAGRDSRHTKVGGAGPNRNYGKRPQISMKTRNPKSRTVDRAYIKNISLKLPWRQ